MPRVAAARSASLEISWDVGFAGLDSNATTVRDGFISLSNSTHFAPSTVVNEAIPVTFPPGRLRLATRPKATGSLTEVNTIGIIVVAALAASAAGGPPAA